MAKINVRLAPSPTGFLHVGTAQSALYNWLFAKKNKGNFRLRIEDTDKERSSKEFEQNIFDALTWLDLNWDGDIIRQSERTGRYRELLEKLLKEKKAFFCYHTKEELEAEQKQQEENKEPSRHICDHKNSEIGEKPNGIIRFKTDPNQTVIFNDKIRGRIQFKAGLLGDFSIARSLEEPLYNFTVIVDDIDMEITQVIRGEDHISNTPKQFLIYEALFLSEAPFPELAHLPLLLAPDRSKLSKRHGATAVTDFKKDYLPEALVNFLGILSYTFSKEILSKEEMVQEFELSKVHKSGAIFNIKKLNWINAQYVKKLSPFEFKKRTGLSMIPDIAIPIITERLERLSEVKEFSYLWTTPSYTPDLLIWKESSKEETKNSLNKIKSKFEELKEFSGETKNILDELSGINKGLIYWPLRVALSGKEKSPNPIDIIKILGEEETIKRINNAIELLS
jgi:nondiscriminating glutamyl-tRNA synthetase